MKLPVEILKQYWGHDKFRPLQEDIVQAVLEKQDVLALLPTGGGKSVCFQVPALCMEGICLVITPLIALMRDQVEQLRSKGIHAVCIHSGMNNREIDIALDNCVNDPRMKFLYLSPERLKTEILKERVKRMNVALLAIDEAHCISQWGYDFRPSYLEIAAFRELIPTVPVIALTATATAEAKKDIQERLAFRNGKIFVKSFARANLSYSCFDEENKDKKLLEIISAVPGTAIVYVRSRRRTQEIAKMLQQKKISAAAYHAGMSTEERNNVQDLWLQNKIRVAVATNAFGMGINKTDVRCVVHMDPPENLEAYYQEAGRAGRDEKKAFAVLLYQKRELDDLHLKIAQKYPPVELIRKVYQSLANYFKIAVGSSLLAAYDFIEEDFIRIYKLPPLETYHALRRLESEGFIQLNEGYHRPSKLLINTDHTSLYDYQLTHPEMDRLIKVILRVYGGELYSGFVPISESLLAMHSGMAEIDIVKKLQFLHGQNLFIYEPKKTAPQIVFTTMRYDAAKLPIQVAAMEKRKKTELEKLSYLTSYTTQQRRCRSVLIQEYFGEENIPDCGTCDVCLKKKKNLSTDHDEITSRVMELLAQGPSLLDELVDRVGGRNKEEVAILIQKMTDEQILAFDKAGKIYILNKNNLK